MKSRIETRDWSGITLVFLLASAWIHAQTPPEPEFPPPGCILVDDMWLPESVVLGDGAFTATPWPNGVVPYAFVSVSAANQSRVLEAFNEIEACSQVRFVPWNSHVNFIAIRQNPNSTTVSTSGVGMVGGPQFLDIALNHWNSKYVIVHELFHALGFVHEQSRVDRDNYVTVNLQHVSLTACNGFCFHNFNIVISVPTGPYDFLSIMHYGQNAFSFTGQPTIVCKPQYAQFQNQIGNRTYMTTSDAQGIATRYGNPSSPSISSISPSTIQVGSPGFTLSVQGHHFFSGSPTQDGVQGTRVKWNGSILDTTFVNKNLVTAWVPASRLLSTGTVSVLVENDSVAGGSSAFAFFSITAPPCASTNDRIGHALAGLGDVNGDSHDDYVVGSPGEGANAGRVRCYSGRTGNVIWSRAGGTGEQFGFSLANAGDVNQDGVDDVVVGAPGYQSWRGYVRILDGTNGLTIRTKTGDSGTTGEFGWSVSGTGDLNLDGIPDIIVGSPAWNSVGKADLISGSSGGIFFSLTASNPQSGSRYGFSVGGGFDMNGDGRPDAIVGAPWFDGAQGQDSGRAEIWSASFGTRLSIKEGDAPYDYFGRSVALCSSTKSNNSGAHALVGASDFGSIFGSGGGTGYVRVFGSWSLLGGYPTLATFTGTTMGDRYGQAVAAAGDVDDDGYTDIIIGAIQDGIGPGQAVGPGYVEVRSVQSGQILHRVAGANHGAQFGWTVAAAGDIDNDTVPDILVGEPFGDVPCPSAGDFHVFHLPVPPVNDKLMITEVVTGNPAAVELTNFSGSSINLTDWKIRWKDGNILTSPSIGVVIAPGESIVIKEGGAGFAETPAGTQVLNILPSSSTLSSDVGVALVHRNGNVVDEVHIAASSSGSYGEGNLGGKFVGTVHHDQSGPLFTLMHVERIWGLDSNSGADWHAAGVRSMGLENMGSGVRGSDPRPLRTVLINEIDDSPDYVEIKNRTGVSLDLKGWYFLCSGGQNAAHVRIDAFRAGLTISPHGFAVLGDSAIAPPELPALVPYVNVSAGGGPGFPFTAGPLSCALYDRYGRLIDLVRATRVLTELVHNHPRAPSAPGDFGFAAVRTGVGDGSFGRNGVSVDTNSGLNFRPYTTRTMGSNNGCSGLSCGLTWQPDSRRQLDVRLNATGQGQGLGLIINAGEDHAGARWSFLFSYGHLFGQGPLFGLGAEAFANWQLLSTIPPWFGFLDSRGSARLDVPSGTLPQGIATDNIYILQDAAGLLTLYTKVIQWDT